MTQPDKIPANDTGPGIVDNVLGRMIGYRLKRAYMQTQPEALRALQEDGLRMVSFSCLSIITDNPGIVQSGLAVALQVERSNLVVVLDELEERGLITRERVPTDRRRYALTATLRGRRLRDRAARKAREAEARVFGRLSEEEHTYLITILERFEGKPMS
ncbi:MAG: MarR family transcriptional regulator [Thiothrix sp.]|nr:MarR family transcriptional regulator [Thiothrix sp.]HPE61715.1 MarR family transcriptional regulator [Thiolinea sp.]